MRVVSWAPALRRSPIISLPLGILIAFIVMRYQGVSANIMSLVVWPLPSVRWSMPPWS